MIALKNTVLPLLGLVLALFFHPVVGVRLDACGEYACGSATWTWDTAKSIKDISESVKDKVCDDHYVYIYLKYHYTVEGVALSSNNLRVENHEECHAKNTVRNTASDSFSHTIKSISVFVCRSDAFADTCYDGGTSNNPYA